MWRYIFWKSITSFLAIIVIALMFYFLFVGFSGNPFNPADFKDPAAYLSKLNQFHINDSVWERFATWITGIFHGNWGDIYKLTGYSNIPDLFFKPLRKSMMVMIPSFFIGMALGLGLGFWAGYKHGKTTDLIINGFVTIFIAIPSFILAVFAIVIGPIIGLPVGFKDSFGTSYMIKSLIMPNIVMTLVSLAGWTYLTRIEVSSILKSDYILSARTKGYSEWFIFRRYVARNALYPYAGSLATSFMVVFGSSLIVEKFFNLQGTAMMMLNASQGGEINVLMFNLIVFSTIGIFAQMIADIAQFMINPIVRSNFSSKTSPITRIKYAYIRNKNAKAVAND